MEPNGKRDSISNEWSWRRIKYGALIYTKILRKGEYIYTGIFFFGIFLRESRSNQVIYQSYRRVRMEREKYSLELFYTLD